MSHNHSYQSRQTATCSALVKEGAEYVCTETVKHYYNTAGLDQLEKEQNDSKTALDAYNVVAAKKEHDDILAEITAVK